ncbi:hypothetical protein ACQKNC_03350 [Lysinibacillus sp. NPDC094177]|uniref:hypothetical protein n=1 Tax=Lysinibacillus sp. NPDC094177 TaxID=3390580 RepID=UPI003CFF78DE
MKKFLAIIVTALVAILGISFLLLNLRYEKEEILHDFPVPRGAIITEKREDKFDNSVSAEWTKASSKGLPLDYELFLKINGWEKSIEDAFNEDSKAWYCSYKKDNELVGVYLSESSSSLIITSSSR